MSEAPQGLVFNIQKFSLHDGPGIRTIVFLKGCPLACMWCSNPEGQSRQPELMHSCDRCIGTDECERCVAVCIDQVIRKDGQGGVSVDHSFHPLGARSFRAARISSASPASGLDAAASATADAASDGP